MKQKSFFERLLTDTSPVNGLEIGFPQDYQFEKFAMLKTDMESLANKYGLTIPAKLKRGKLIFEIKSMKENDQIKKITKSPVSLNSYSLNNEELDAIECAF